jgi:hypothetical protein
MHASLSPSIIPLPVIDDADRIAELVQSQCIHPLFRVSA